MQLHLKNSIVYGNNTPRGDCFQAAALLTNTGNIIGSGNCGAGTNGSSQNPNLQGPTSGYYIPRAGGSAIDAVTCLTSTVTNKWNEDQRGEARPNPAGQNDKCDRGAIEDPGWSPPPPPSDDDGDGDRDGSGSRSRSGDDDEDEYKAPPPSTCETLPGNIEVKPMTESTECQTVSGAGISDPKVREEAIAAVDVWSWVAPDTKVCFKGESGSIRFIDTDAMPRKTMDKETFSDGGMICAMIDGPGIVALAPGPAPAPAQGQDPAPAEGPPPAQDPAPAPACAAEKQSNAARADGSVVHIVQSGECLWTIANVYGLSFGELARLNGFEWSGQTLPPIQPGQEIVVSAAAG